MGTVKVIEARESDLDSLKTIVPRSFHPVNPYIKKTMPDTALVGEWWRKTFAFEIDSPSCHPLVAIDPETGKDIGILSLKLMDPDERGAGSWNLFPVTSDHDEAMYWSMVDCMIENRERLMLGRQHYLIGLFGADHAFKGKGVGTALLTRACELADDEGVEMFVQGNAMAKGFYERLGFREAGKSVIGDDDYVGYMLVRPSKVT